jgi:hypothetical protein
MHTLMDRIRSAAHGILFKLTGFLPRTHPQWRLGMLEEGWVIANHKLVSFHAAFLSSLLSIPFLVEHRTDVLNFMFNPMEKSKKDIE